MIVSVSCGCGEVVEVSVPSPPANSPIAACPKCGTGHSLGHQKWLWYEPDAEWIEAEVFCEGCGKAVDWEFAHFVGSPDDSCYLCEGCFGEPVQ
jgi:hypothetical protein